MKRILTIILLLLTYMQAELNDLLDINPLKMTKNILEYVVDGEQPDWVKSHRKGTFISKKDDKYYFIGISDQFQKTKIQAALDNSRKNGLAQISEFISVSMDTSSNRKITNTNSGYDSVSTRNSTSISFVELDGISPLQTYVLHIQGKIIGYSLFELTAEEYQKKKKENDIKTTKYNNLLSELRDNIRTNNVHKAKDIIYELQGFKQSSKDLRFKQLLEKLNNTFQVDIQVNKERFKVGESLKITLKPTKSIYAYVLMEYGNNHKIKLLFPSRFEPNNFITKQKVKTIKRLKILKKYITKDINKIIVYSSNSPIDFLNYVDSSYELSNSSNAQWKTMLDTKLNNSIIFQKTVKFIVDSGKLIKQKICIKFIGKSKLKNKILKTTKKQLKKSFKITRNCSKANFKVEINVEDELSYSDAANGDIRIINYNYLLVDKDDEEIYESDNKALKFPKRSSNNVIYRDIKHTMKLNLKELQNTIKGI